MHTIKEQTSHSLTPPDLQGRVILITGGGSGLGAAASRLLAAAGAQVIVADVHGERAESVSRGISAEGGRAAFQMLDVRDERRAREVIDRVVKEYGRLDALINSAGIDVTKSVTELSFAEWDQVLAVNLRGPFAMSKIAFEHMQRQANGGHIVHVVSTAARRAWANASAYHASKWGLLGLSHALHVEGRRHRIKVTALIAGGMRTPFLLDRFPEIDRSTLQDPESVAQTIRFVLTQPAGTVIPEMLVLPEQETSWP